MFSGALCFVGPYSCEHFVDAILFTHLLTPAYIYFSAFSSPENSCTLLIVQTLLEIPWQLLLNIGHGTPALNLRRKCFAQEYCTDNTLSSNVLTPEWRSASEEHLAGLRTLNFCKISYSAWSGIRKRRNFDLLPCRNSPVWVTPGHLPLRSSSRASSIVDFNDHRDCYREEAFINYHLILVTVTRLNKDFWV